MIGLSLPDIERELLDLAEQADDGWELGVAEKLRALARRVGVQIETDKLDAAA